MDTGFIALLSIYALLIAGWFLINRRIDKLERRTSRVEQLRHSMLTLDREVNAAGKHTYRAINELSDKVNEIGEHTYDAINQIGKQHNGLVDEVIEGAAKHNSFIDFMYDTVTWIRASIETNAGLHGYDLPPAPHPDDYPIEGQPDTVDGLDSDIVHDMMKRVLGDLIGDDVALIPTGNFQDMTTFEAVPIPKDASGLDEDLPEEGKGQE